MCEDKLVGDTVSSHLQVLMFMSMYLKGSGEAVQVSCVSLTGQEGEYMAWMFEHV